jgi:hypothetical protein
MIRRLIQFFINSSVKHGQKEGENFAAKLTEMRLGLEIRDIINQLLLPYSAINCRVTTFRHNRGQVILLVF